MKTVLLKQRSHLPQVLSLILAATFAGCTDTGAPDPVLLEIVGGDGQEAEFASDLTSPLVVQVTGVDGLPRGWVRVEWRVLQGGGSIEPEGMFSDEEGLVRARWILGTELGDQSVTVAARGTSTTFRAWATPPPPADWAEVVEIRPGALVEGTDLLASVWLLNRWPGTVGLSAPTCSFTKELYPALYSASGERVAYHSAGGYCFFLFRHTLAPGDSLLGQWGMGITSVGSGEYTLRFKFAVDRIHGEPATLPDTMMTVVIGG